MAKKSEEPFNSMKEFVTLSIRNHTERMRFVVNNQNYDVIRVRNGRQIITQSLTVRRK